MTELDYTKSVGVYISNLRATKGLSQKELSENSDLSRTTISDLEKGSRLPSTKDLLSLCKVFDVTPNDILSYGLQANFSVNNSEVDRLKSDLHLLAKMFLSFMKMSRQSKVSFADLAFNVTSNEMGLDFVKQMDSVKSGVDLFVDTQDAKAVIEKMVENSNNDYLDIDDAFLFLINAFMKSE